MDKSKRPKRSRIIPPEKRRKVATACDNCKKRKYKCSGLQPCYLCQRRGHECIYSSIDKRSLKGERMAKQKQLELENGSSKSSFNDVKLPSITETLNRLNNDCSTFNLQFPQHLLPNTKTPILPPIKNIELKSNLKKNQCLTNMISNNYRLPVESSQSIDNTNDFFEIDAQNKLIYNATTGANAVLHETQIIFRNIIGSTKFDQDITKSNTKEPKNLIEPTSNICPLLSKRECIEMFELFDTQFNWQYFVFDRLNFIKTLNEVLKSKTDSIEILKHKVIIYLILAIGTVIKDYNQGDFVSLKSINFFGNALYFEKQLSKNCELWLLQSNYLQSFYYQFTGNLTNSWFKINNAINYAKILKIHKIKESNLDPRYRKKLFRSLYLCGQMFSILSGLPFCFNEDECEDFNQEYKKIEESKLTFISNPKDYVCDPDTNKSFETKFDYYKIHIVHISAKITRICYRNSEISMEIIKILTNELENWLASLPSELLVKNCSSGSSDIEVKHRYACIFLQACYIYSIFLISRIILLYEKNCQYNLKLKNSMIDLNFIKEFKQASAKSCGLMIIALVSSESESNIRRLEPNMKLDCALVACLTLGVYLIDDLDSQLLEILKLGLSYLSSYDKFNPIAKNHFKIINQMIESLSNYHFRKSNEVILQNLNVNHLQDEIVPILNHLKSFEVQHFFLSNDANSIDDHPCTNKPSIGFLYGNDSI